MLLNLATDKSTDVSDTAQHLVFIHSTNRYSQQAFFTQFDNPEEPTTMMDGKDLFNRISAIIDGLALSWKKISGSDY